MSRIPAPGFEALCIYLVNRTEKELAQPEAIHSTPSHTPVMRTSHVSHQMQKKDLGKISQAWERTYLILSELILSQQWIYTMEGTAWILLNDLLSHDHPTGYQISTCTPLPTKHTSSSCPQGRSHLSLPPSLSLSVVLLPGAWSCHLRPWEWAHEVRIKMEAGRSLVSERFVEERHHTSSRLNSFRIELCIWQDIRLMSCHAQTKNLLTEK